MKIVIGSDHGGYELKSKLIEFLKNSKYDAADIGTHSKDSCDYPLIGFEVARAVSVGRADRGVLICRTGIGMAIIANKVPGIRAGVCYSVKMAKSSREHNDCNVLVLAADYTEERLAKKILKIWLNTNSLGDRHARRVKQIDKLETKLRK
ncbi:MAG: ribose 5-phosphate isomerase B [Candidatus Omnitrophica bacterium]|nr:ribose 5-phosphate isomerase B [Candidatus Omnitrophota bacterium]